MNGLRTRVGLQHLDAAERERKARIDAMGDPDEDVLRAYREEDRHSAQMLGAAVVVAMFVLGVSLALWAMDDLILWALGGPTIVVRVP